MSHETDRDSCALFKNTIAEKIALNLTSIADTYGLGSDQFAIKRLVESTFLQKYQHILGLGQYSGKDKRMLRLELTCNKKWHNNILSDMKNINMEPFLQETQSLCFRKGHGNSYCSLLSLLMINTNPNKQYNFVHIPKDYNVIKAVNELDTQLKYLSQNCA